MIQAWLPDYIYTGGRFRSGLALVADSGGQIVELSENAPPNATRLAGRAMLPGLVNAIRTLFNASFVDAPYRSQNATDSFWTWREQMYAAATQLSPEQIYNVSRMAFLEMAQTGITAVGEFHYLNHSPDGSPYSDRNLLAHEVIRAANDVGIRIALLRVAYARSGFNVELEPATGSLH